MQSKTARKIVKIDEAKCDGCGLCVPSCAEGAIQIIDGKARLVSEIYCDGLGACLGECPMGAITIEERVAAAFDEKATEEHLAEKECEPSVPCGCPSERVTQFEPAVPNPQSPVASPHSPIPSPQSPIPRSTLAHWPVQLTLVPPHAPFLQGADLLLAADCAPFAYANFHQDFLKDHSLLIACPKLDNMEAHVKKLTDILQQSSVKSLTVLHMEVPCCFGLVFMAKQALQASGKDIPFRDVKIGIKGDIKG
ncbi:MAG: 4Fe-4S binding protein [Dehalococcoidales bacterium]|nr:4Fe-4S binding protein [Dehalococcoidales bacterium]